MQKITVFMSTFNGEKYLKEQIDSILKQEEVTVELVVRDDGSTDKTIDILAEYALIYRNFHYFKGENIGYGKSFLKLFNIMEYDSDYFAFADQDDVWLPRKLICGINKICDKCDVPSIYFSNMTNVDAQLNYISTKDFSSVKISLGSVYTRQRIAGCTMIFNKKLYNEACKTSFDNYNHHISHEWIYLLCIALGGNVVHGNESYILYRRHLGTVTSVGSGIIKRFLSEFNQINKTKNDKLYLSQLILKNYGNEISTINVKRIYMIANYKKNIFYRLRLIFGRFLNSGNLILNIRIKFFVLIGAF